MSIKTLQKRLFEPAAGVSLLALLAVLPYSTAASNILEGLLLLFWLLSGTVREDLLRLASRAYARILLAFLALMFLSLAWTPADSAVAWEAVRKFRKIIVLFVAWCFLSSRPAWRDRFLWTGLISFGLLALICVGIYLDLPGFPEKNPGQGAILVKSHIAQGFIMSILVVIGVEKCLTGPEARTRLVGAAAALLAIVVTFFMTNGRTGYLSITAALLFLVIFYPCRVKPKFFVLAALVAALGVLGANSSRVMDRIAAVQSDLQEFSQGDADTSSGTRLTYWLTAAEIIREHPLTGMGVGGFSKVYCEKQTKETPEVCLKRWKSGNAHSDFLNFGAQMGLPGVLCWIAFLLCCFAAALKAQDLRNHLIGIGFLFAYAAGGAVNSFMWDVTEGTLAALCFAWILSMPGAPAVKAHPAT